jgi:hypothetical protein
VNDEKFEKIETQLDSTLQTIETKYSKLPKTDSNIKAKEQEVSLQRIKGLWLSYCIAKPQSERCKT